MESEKIFEVEVVLFGRVQGVFLRQSVKEFADSLNIKGFALNRKDGSVKILAQGREEDLRNFIGLIKTNPGNSNIERIEEKWNNEIIEIYQNFKIF